MSPEMEIRARLPEIARSVEPQLPPGWGFCLLTFPLDDREGTWNYISNSKRHDIIKAMKEFIAKSQQSFGTHEDNI